MKIAILTSKIMADLQPYDRELLNRLNEISNVNASPVIWEESINKLNDFDAAVFRTTWGYHEEIVLFKEFLSYLDTLNIPVLNPTDIIRENLDKSYLKTISDEGINIIQTEYIEQGTDFDLPKFIAEKKWQSFIIKPRISAGSYKTFLCSIDDMASAQSDFDNLINSNNIMLQEFRPEVKTEGEFSTIFFNRDTHYTINKIPQSGDYRVQYQFGGKYRLVQPNEITMKRTWEAAELFIDKCLYVRVDGLFFKNDFHIMEVELIEPDLYLNLVPEFIPIFAEEIIKRIT